MHKYHYYYINVFYSCCLSIQSIIMLSLLSLFLMFTLIIAQDVIWYQDCSASPSGNIDVNWTVVTDGGITLTTGPNNNAGGGCAFNYCWRICGDTSVPNDGFIYRISSTEGYESISMTFDLNPHGMCTESEYCSFQYSIGGNPLLTSSWTEFFNYWDCGAWLTAYTKNLPSNAANQAYLGIKLLAYPASGNCCHLSRAYLRGIPITTKNPTAMPTTSMPTTC